MKPYIYQPHSIRFAFCYRVYFSWRTHRGRPASPLTNLQRKTLDALVHPYNIRVLECVTNETDLRCIVSLRPTETISACASKLKGRVSKWLRDELNLTAPQSLLSKGYFACTTGKTKTRIVDRYLSLQAEHHGYANLINPPIFVERYRLHTRDKARLAPKHAVVIAKFHLVFSTTLRRDILGSTQGKKITQEWLTIQETLQFALLKVSFVPDHVHIALQSHPAVSPAAIAAALMNAAQQVVLEELIQARVGRLWMNSAYVGSFGELSSAQIRKYLEGWEG